VWEGLGMHEPLTILSERVDDRPLWRAQVARMGVQPCGTRPSLRMATGRGSGWAGCPSSGWPIASRQRRIGCSMWSRGRRNGSPPCVVAQATAARRWTAALIGGPACGRREVTMPAGAPVRARGRSAWCGGMPLRPERVHLDSPTARGSWAVTPEGVCPCGPSKEQRSDWPQGQGQ